MNASGGVIGGGGITGGGNGSSGGVGNGINAIANAPIDPVVPISGLGQRPILADTSAYIVDKLAAQQLGKAFFWDSLAGSDGQACASCHFHAGADIRVPNQVNPGIPSNPDTQFHHRASNPSAATGPNATLASGDFPFHQLADINNRNSAIVYDTNDRFASEGTFAGTFIPSGPPPATGNPPGFDNCIRTVDPTDPFNDATSVMFRRVEPRNTPSVINAAFNFRQFWDGRANNVFNGNDPFGSRSNLANPAAGILVSQGTGAPKLLKIAIPNASLASQAVGPATSNFEMSCLGRTFADIGCRSADRTEHYRRRGSDPPAGQPAEPDCRPHQRVWSRTDVDLCGSHSQGVLSAVLERPNSNDDHADRCDRHRSGGRLQPDGAQFRAVLGPHDSIGIRSAARLRPDEI